MSAAIGSRIAEHARDFVRYAKASASAWERANNHGRDDERYRFLLRVHEARGKDAESLAKRYGFDTDWPGLYPTLHRHDTGHFYNTSDVAAVERLFATPEP